MPTACPMWLATQHGVDRYDGYEFRMFKNDPRQANSLCGVFMLSLFKDRSGTLWMGCEHDLAREKSRGTVTAPVIG
jgi:hypothetical protein